MQTEIYNRWKNELSRFKTQKSQRDRAYLLLQGELFKTKKQDQIQKDDLCAEMAREILNGEISVDRYMDGMIEIMGDWDD